MTTRKRETVFEEYFLEVAGMMGLAHWTFIFQHESEVVSYEGHQANMMVECWIQRYGATITLAEHTLDMSRSEIRQTVVHELMHCHLTRLADLLELSRKVLGKAESERTEDIHIREEEYAVDAMSAFWAQRLPLPPAKWRA